MNSRQLPPDTELDIRSLRTFVAVAEELNFTRAAGRLFVAQQAVSRAIRDLERRLGVDLFARTTRRVALTADGEHVLERARELVALHDALLDELGAARRPVVIDLLSEGRLTGRRVLEAVRATTPELEFRGRYGGGTGAAIRQLQSGEIDLALGRADWIGRPRSRVLRQRVVRLEPLALLLPDDHPLAALEAVPLAALAGLEIDTNPATDEALEWSDLARQVLSLAHARPTPPHVAAVGLDDQSHHLARQGLPILTAIDHVAVPGGVVRAIVEPVLLYPWSLIWRQGIRADALDAVDRAVDALARDNGWIDVPKAAWLPEPEASAIDLGSVARRARYPGD